MMREKNLFKFVVGVVGLFIFIAIQWPLISPAAELPSPDIIKAAQEGIRIFLTESGVENIKQFGLSGQEEAGTSSLGEGFQVYAVGADSLLNSGSTQELSTLAVPTTIWQFLVLNGGKAIALLTVDRMNNAWVPVSIGAAGLAQQLSQLREVWPAAEGYEVKLIRIYAAKSDYIEVSQAGKEIGIIPMISARVAMGLPNQDLDPFDFHSSKSIINTLRSPVSKNVLQYQK